MSKIVTYDLCAPNRDYTDLINAIKSYPGWARICESSWLIVSDRSCVAIRDHLKSYIDSNDRIFVASLTGEAAWYNVICDPNYLKQNL